MISYFEIINDDDTNSKLTEDELEFEELQTLDEDWEHEALKSPKIEPNIKCGEVFLEDSERFTLICSMCTEEYNDLISFGNHILNVHMKTKPDLEEYEPIEGLDVSESDETPRISTSGTMEEVIAIDEIKIEVVDSDDLEDRMESFKPQLESDHIEKIAKCDRSGKEEADANCSIKTIGQHQVYSCIICNWTYNSKESYLYHASRRHGISCNKKEEEPPPQGEAEENCAVKIIGGNEVFSCRICNKAFKLRRAYYVHARKRHGLRPAKKEEEQPKGEAEANCSVKTIGQHDVYSCITCHTTYNSKRSYLIHAKRQHGLFSVKKMEENSNKSLKETAVDQNAISASTLEIETVNNNGFKCSECGATYKHKRSLVVHAKKHHGMSRARTGRQQTDEEMDDDSEVFTCVICSLTYRQQKSLYKHIKACHKEEAPNLLPSREPVKCLHCDETFRTTKELRIHSKANHPGEANYPCPHCDRKFRSNFGRQVHIYGHMNYNPHKCPYCPKSFRLSTYLTKHINVHLQIKNHKCQYCEKTFVLNDDRKNHEKRHLGIKPFQCEKCGMRFGTYSHIADHRKKHLNIRDHKCELCDKEFYTRYQLKRHTRTHTGERPFKCDICDRSFPWLKNLRAHQKIHEEIKHECTICGSAFTTSTGLFSHRKTHGEDSKRITTVK